MSLFYIVQWFDSPYGRPVVNTEMRDFEQPLVQTKSWLAEQASPAGAIVIVYRQGPKIFDLTPLRSHVLINEMARIVGGFEDALYTRVDEILTKQGHAPARRTKKTSPGRKPTKRPGTKRPGKKASGRKRGTVIPKTKGLGRSLVIEAPVRPKTAKAKPKRRKPPGSGRYAPGVKNVGDILGDIKKRPEIKPCKSFFVRGMQTVASQGVLNAVAPRDIDDAMRRFVQCDWGDVERQTVIANNRHTHDRRDRIYGSYQSRRSGTEFWIIASPLENTVVVLLPHEI